MRTDRQIGAAKKAQTARLGQSGAAGKRKRCKKGKSCGASCINSSKFCLVDLPWVGQGLGKVRNEIQKSPKKSKEGSKPPTFQPASQALPPGAQKVTGVLAALSNPDAKTLDVNGILNANDVNWQSGNGKGAEYVASGVYGSFVHIPTDRLAKGLEGKFPGGVGIKYGEVSPKEVELLKLIGESGAGPRLIAARYESEPTKPGGDPYSSTRRGMIAMERIPGKTLENSILDLSEDQMGDAYLKALSKLHRAGISHGDAHLGNAIIQPNGEVKFIDFGFAKQSFHLSLVEITNRLWGVEGPIANRVRDNIDRVTKEMDKFDLNKYSMTPENREKAAKELIEELYKGI